MGLKEVNWSQQLEYINDETLEILCKVGQEIDLEFETKIQSILLLNKVLSKSVKSERLLDIVVSLLIVSKVTKYQDKILTKIHQETFNTFTTS